jgi:hypothetical protein
MLLVIAERLELQEDKHNLLLIDNDYEFVMCDDDARFKGSACWNPELKLAFALHKRCRFLGFQHLDTHISPPLPCQPPYPARGPQFPVPQSK